MEKVTELLKPHVKEIEITGERSGLHIVLTVKNGMDEESLIRKAAEARIKIYGMSTYSIETKDAKQPPEIILGCAGIPEDDLEDAIFQLLSSWGL